MKKFVLPIITFLFSVVAQASTIDINGTAYPVDTLACYQVGPGTTYTRFNVTIGSTAHHLYLYTVDLTNPYIKLEEAHGDKLGSTKLMTRMHQDMDSAGHRPIGSVNCNFWVVASQAAAGSTWEGWLGQSFAGTAKDGMLLTEPMDWNEGHGDRGYVMIDDLNRALIRNMYFSGRLIKGTHSRKIKDVNRPSVTPSANEVCLFNRHIGTTRAIADTVEEYIFEPVAGQAWSINDTMTCVIRSKNTTGGTALSGNQGALQCRGTGKTFMTNYIAVGDTFQIKLGMYSAPSSASRNAGELSSADSIAPHIQQMVTGNCLVMANGVLTHRNTNEGYNNQNYPRTMLATNNEGTRFWMLVSEKPGNYTAEMCGILKNDGATWAAGMDGGGSAQFNLFGAILNPTTESTPRAVANAMFLVSTAPDDNQVTRLENKEAGDATMQAYTAFIPSLRAYNQYGNIVADGFEYSMSVSPAALGSFSEDGRTFIAGATPGTGILTITAGSASLNIPITVETGEWQMRLDSVVVDHHPYTLEVLTVDANPSPVPADVLTWTSADESIAVVENGVVRGISNGRTLLTGTIGDKQLTQIVDVQIPTASLMDWQWNTYFKNVGVDGSKGFNPECLIALCATEDPDRDMVLVMNFTYATTRAAYVSFILDAQSYGLPDSLVVHLSPSFSVKNFNLYGHANNDSKETMITLPGSETIRNYRLAVSPAQWGVDTTDRAIYPFHLTGIKLVIDKATAGEQSVSLSNPECIYSAWREPDHNDLENISPLTSGEQNGQPLKVLHDGQLIIMLGDKQYNALGQLIK